MIRTIKILTSAMCIVGVVVASVNSVSFALWNFASNEFKDLQLLKNMGGT